MECSSILDGGLSLFYLIMNLHYYIFWGFQKHWKMRWCPLNSIIDITHEAKKSSRKKWKSFLQIIDCWWNVWYKIQSPFKMIVSQIPEKYKTIINIIWSQCFLKFRRRRLWIFWRYNFENLRILWPTRL
jgi:hypothetical protein